MIFSIQKTLMEDHPRLSEQDVIVVRRSLGAKLRAAEGVALVS